MPFLIATALPFLFGCDLFGSDDDASEEKSLRPIDCSATTTENRDTVTIPCIPVQFTVPSQWIEWHDQFNNNFHLTDTALDSVRDGDLADWDYEYARVLNFLFPYSACALHVGGEGWGYDGVSYVDIQLRVYVFTNSLSRINREIIRIMDETPETMFAEKDTILVHGVRIQYDTAFTVSQDSSREWHQTVITFTIGYTDYGGLAHIDFRIKKIGDKAVAFVFMYTGSARNKDEILDGIMNSIR
jgi:hypothetical protein